MLPSEREKRPRTGVSVSKATTNNKEGTSNKISRDSTPKRALPMAGYLFKEQVDTENIIDPQDMGLTVLQARRKGAVKYFHSPERYTVQAKSIQDQVQMKKRGRPILDQQMWGDSITTSDTWPKVNPKGHIRVLFYNVHGISYKNNFFEMDMLMQLGGQVQADIMLIAEINLNLHQQRTRSNLTNSIRNFDKYARVQMAYPPDPPYTTSAFNMGGNMAIVQGGLSGRCGEQGADVFGRWSWITIRGQHTNLVIISGYKVGKNSGRPGGTSVAQQEVRAMLRRDHKLANKPREAFDEDLANFCTVQQNKGNEVILMLDANTPLDSAEARAFCTAANMYSIAEYKFPLEPLPRTHQLGSKCIDHCLVTKKLLNWTKKFGYFPFYAHSLYDHRGMVLDLHCHELFGKFRVDETRRTTRKLRSSNPRDSDKYRLHLSRLLKAAGIFDKVPKLCAGLSAQPQEVIDRRWKHLQKYNRTLKELMIAAENKLKPKHATLPYWSPILKKKGQELRYYNKRIKADEEYGDLGVNIIPPAGLHVDKTIATSDDLHQKQAEVKSSWRDNNRNGEALRKQYLLERAERAKDQRDVTREAALKQIINAETSKALHRRHGAALKKQHPGSLKKILVPFPDSSVPAPTSEKRCDVWREIDDDDTINKLFVHLNRQKLLMSTGRDFAPGGLLHSIVGPQGCSAQADDIIDGVYDTEHLQHLPRPDTDTLLAFIKRMARPKDKNGKIVKDMKWSYDSQDYRASFSKKSEETSCGPSGLHMAHWIAACEDEELSALHASFIEAAFKIGQPYERWLTSYHAMIQKKDKAWANAMRIIQLLEGDYNAGLRYLVQRRGVAYAEQNDIYSGSTYGGRKGKNTHQVLGRIQATNEYCRLARTPAALADVDAINCFDCMTHSGIGFFQRRQGSPKNLVQTQCTTLMRTKHHIKTGLGVSSDVIQQTAAIQPQGSGQGGGASVGNWQSHNDPMILTFQDLCKACNMITPDQKEVLKQWVISFVDDNKLLMNFEPHTSIEAIYNAMKKGVTTWRDILRITGGDLELDKTWVGILTYDYNTYTGKHMGKHSLYRAGVPKLVDSNVLRQAIVMPDGTKFRELKPNQGLRLLGVRMALSGSFQDEYQYRKSQIQILAGKLRAHAFDERDAWLIYQTRYRPMLRYCLPITTFSDKQCLTIQSPFICAFLNKLKLNRHMPRAVIWGPRQYGGLDVMNIEVEQLVAHVHLLITSIRKGNETGKSMLMAMSMYQLTLGCQRPFWDIDPEFYPIQSDEHLSMQYMWTKLRQVNATLYLPGMWRPVIQHQEDSAIIDDFVSIAKERRGTSSHLRGIQIELANACRLYLNVTLRSEITTEDGQHIAPWAFFGRRRNTRSELVYPFQPKPPEHAWKEWRNLITAAYMAAARVDMTIEQIPINNRQLVYNQETRQALTWPPLSTALPLIEILECMPDVWRQAVGQVNLPPDDGMELAERLRSGQTINAWSDGSVCSGIGAHAYTLRSHCTGNDEAISGSATTPGHPDTISSLRTEHYGALAVVLVVMAIEWKYSIGKTGYVTIHIDNSEVVNRTKFGVSDGMSADKHAATDFDVWKETHTIIKKLNTTVCAKWVKGHQDKMLQEQQGGIGPMPLEAHYNIMVDQMAEHQRCKSRITLSVLPMTSDCASLIIDNNLITTKLEYNIRMARTARPLKEYIKHKNGWSEETFMLVDWDAFNIFMGRLSASKRAKVIKLQHNWQNTGYQKGLFLRNAGESDEATVVERCPMGCGALEIPLHYLACSKINSQCEVWRGVKGIKSWLKNSDTEPGLVATIMRIIRHYLDGNVGKLDVWNFTREKYKGDLEKLVQDQKALGWTSLFQGRLCRQWRNIQTKHYSALNASRAKYKTGTWWAAGLIQQLIYFTLNSWQIRNNFLHRDREAQERNTLRRQLIQTIEGWYDKAGQLGVTFQKYFRLPLLQRKTHSMKLMQSWLATITAQCDYQKRRTPAHANGRRSGGVRGKEDNRRSYEQWEGEGSTSILDYYDRVPQPGDSGSIRLSRS